MRRNPDRGSAGAPADVRPKSPAFSQSSQTKLRVNAYALRNCNWGAVFVRNVDCRAKLGRPELVY